MSKTKQTEAENHSEDELVERFEKIIELLKELRSTFLRYIVVEAEGQIPSRLLAASVSYLCGAKGFLTMVFHGHKCSCFFQPGGESERIDWEFPEEGDYEPGYDLCCYEETLFSIWDYDTGYSLERGEDSKAVWCIDDFGDVNRLEDIAEKLDKLLLPVYQIKGYRFTAVEVAGALRPPESPKWMPSRVDWSYIKYLDEAIKTCETASRMADLAAKKPAEKEQNATPTKKSKLKPILYAIGGFVGFLAALFTCLGYLLGWLGPIKAFIYRIVLRK
jgi:hypothetical protein